MPHARNYVHRTESSIICEDRASRRIAGAILIDLYLVVTEVGIFHTVSSVVPGEIARGGSLAPHRNFG